jgi:hypothetical protein
MFASSAEEIAGIIGAISGLVTACAGLLAGVSRVRRLRRDDGSDGGGERVDPPDGDGDTGGAGQPPTPRAAKPPPRPVQTWVGAARTVPSRPRLPAPRVGPAWWARQAVEPSNGWSGPAASEVPRRAPGEAPAPGSGAATRWWLERHGGPTAQGARERSST